MKSYLIISPHTDEDCRKVIKDTLAAGYLTHFTWGCKDGEHTGWAFIEADSKPEAMLVVPSSARKDARAVEVRSFSTDEVKRMH